MILNGLKPPEAFVQIIDAINRGKLWYTWRLKEAVDAYGNSLEADLDVYPNVEQIASATDRLPNGFEPNDYYGVPYQEDVPGGIPDILDFSQIVAFGRMGTGAPFCYDFREGLQEPSVILFDDSYARWRRVAPNFRAYIDLFEPDDDLTEQLQGMSVEELKRLRRHLDEASAQRQLIWPTQVRASRDMARIDEELRARGVERRIDFRTESAES